MESLEQIRDALRRQLVEDARFSMVNARLILRTGVNLTAIQPLKSRDRAVVAKVLATLKDMGFDLIAQPARGGPGRE